MSAAATAMTPEQISAAVESGDLAAATVADFVKRFEGTKVIEKVLIANNGNAAVKCMKSIRQWAYTTFGNRHAVKFVVMVTPDDMKANAEFVRIAEQHVDVPGGSNNNNYANVDLIIDIAVRMGVQAVWAGWGHASELPELPDGLSARGIAFMGPPGHAMRSLGDKISSTIVAQSADVPTMPWSGSGLQIDCAENTTGGELHVPEELYLKGCVTTAKEGLDAAIKIGFPVMIKASEGGGGKGIRKVSSAEAFPTAFRQVLAEVPGSPIFIMKLASGARHLEVQLLADEHGQCIAIFGRDCSVQRRHQKIIEEAPASIATAEQCDEMEKAAIRLGKLVGYVSTGTVEWLYSAEDGSFQFLELNPRLQVEHPCSEAVSGINLPAAQLQIAMGLPLHRLPDIRELYSEDRFGTSKIPFDSTTLGTPGPDQIAKPKPNGAIVAVRVTAENPEEGFKPSSGVIQELTFRSAPNVWGYFSTYSDGSLHEFADSQFGHIFAWGATREQARKSMVCALNELSIRADFRTTIEYIIKLLELDKFKSNDISTEWLDGLIAQKMIAYRPEPLVAVTCGTAHIAAAQISSRLLDFQQSLARGQLLPLKTLKQAVKLDIIYESTKYAIEATRTGPTNYALVMNGSIVDVKLNLLADGGSLVRVNGESTVVYMKEEIDKYRMNVGGRTVIFDKENDPTMIRAVSAGKLLHYTVDDGAHVNAGEAFAEIEVMKMVMSLFAQATGRIKHEQIGGHIMIPGDLIASLELDDPETVSKPTEFASGFSNPMPSDYIVPGDEHQQLVYVIDALASILSGFTLPSSYSADRVTALVAHFFSLGQTQALPLLETREILSALRGRIDSKVVGFIEEQLKMYEESVSSILCKFPSQKIASIIDAHAATLDGAEQDAFLANSAPLQALAKSYRGGLKEFFLGHVQKLLQQYLDIEQKFKGSAEENISAMCKENADNLEMVVGEIVAHTQVQGTSEVITALLDALFDARRGIFSRGAAATSPCGKAVLDTIEQLAQLSTTGTAAVALKARAILVQREVPAFEKRQKSLETIFSEADEFSSSDQIADLVGQATSVFDVLMTLFYHNEFTMQKSALEVYVRRAYVAYNILNVSVVQEEQLTVATWRFRIPVRTTDDLEGQVRKLTLGARNNVSSPTLLAPPDALSESQRVVSIGDLASYARSVARESPVRLGVMAAFLSLEHLESKFALLLNKFRDAQLDVEEPINILNISVKMPDGDDSFIIGKLDAFVSAHRDDLYALQIRRVTFLIHKVGAFPLVFTFRERLGFKEDAIYRHLDPALAFKLEIGRLGKYSLEHCPTKDPKLHLYYGTHTTPNGRFTEKRFFVRTVMRDHPLSNQDADTYFTSVGDSIVLAALNELELVFSDPRYGATDCNHLFINAVPVLNAEPSKFVKSLQGIISKYALRLWKLRVLEAEIRITFQPDPLKPEFFVRVVVSNFSGHYMKVHVYREEPSKVDDSPMYQGIDPDDLGPLHGTNCVAQYEPKEQTQLKRFAAQAMGTTYVHDYIDLLTEILRSRWASVAATVPGVVPPKEQVVCHELVLGDSDTLVELKKGETVKVADKIGMVAWRVTLYPPECPSGRDIILISNDVTHMIGSFGPAEDSLFHKASVMARQRKIPRIYISVNSGARIGLAQEVLDKFQVAWVDQDKPSKGFEYLYLNEEDYNVLSGQGSVVAEPVHADGKTRYKITDIIGLQHGIGVECLQGSGLIAGETSAAYEETFTCTLVSCRSVGIGAYLVRLGQRAVQGESSHIILTGANALNKLLGKDVYTSNNQLGGPQIMYNNGVSHLCVRDDFEGMRAVLHWISYLPTTPVPPITNLPYTIDARNVVYPEDPVDRDVTYEPPSGAYDPRLLITGSSATDTGMFDRGSFVELLSGWAKTVVTGRARIGGIPVGVIAVETRPCSVEIPADPANLVSEAKVVQQAGQVWYPDSAFKTAQAISDVDKERLPLFILANWRGFSGGMNDMYEEVLKFGAMIVDNLQKFRQPVFVYLPPRGELRGGAWVVVDPKINPAMMEMYADVNTRGGVLEAEGTVSVKFRKKTQLLVMARIDPEYKALSEELKTAPVELKKAIQTKMQARYEALAPMYHQVAVQFADLHDTPGRMKAKNCISSIIPWKSSRRFFHGRLRRRLYVQYLLKEISNADPDSSEALQLVMLKRWYGEFIGSQQASMWEEDQKVVEWIISNLGQDGKLAPNSSIQNHLDHIRQEKSIDRVKKIAGGDSETAFQCVGALLGSLTPAQLEELHVSLSSSLA